jgi:hypothetical protein
MNITKHCADYEETRTEWEDVDRPDSATGCDLVGKDIDALSSKYKEWVVVRFRTVTVDGLQGQTAGVPPDVTKVVFRIGENAFDERETLVREERAIRLHSVYAQRRVHEPALATRLVAVAGESDHVLASTPAYKVSVASMEKSGADVQFTSHDERRLVRVDGALLLEQIRCDFKRVAENEALTDDVNIHNFAIDSRPVCEAKPEFFGGEVEDVTKDGDRLRARRNGRSLRLDML